MDSAFLVKKKKNKIKYFLLDDNGLRSKSILISRNSKREKFFTDNNSLYFDYINNQSLKKNKQREDNSFLDSLNYKIIDNYQKYKGKKNSYLIEKYNFVTKKIKQHNERVVNNSLDFLDNLSPIRLWNASMLTAVLIGMISMSFIYRYLGQGVSAKDNSSQQEVAGVMVSTIDNKKIISKKEKETDGKKINNLQKNNNDTEFEKKVKKMVKGYPIEKMLPYIFEQDKTTASFLIAIAKKESNWGKRVPVLNGQDCYNYWGYRQKRKRMGSGGHTCFDNRKDAIGTVGKRMHKLIFDYGKNTPNKMVIWKCGNSCATHSQKGVKKWISDVDLYLKKLNYSK